MFLLCSKVKHVTGLTKLCSSLVLLVFLLSPHSVASQRTDNQEGATEGETEGNGAWDWDWGKKEKYDKKFKEMLQTVGICLDTYAKMWEK